MPSHCYARSRAAQSIIGAFAICALMVVGASGCGSTTVVHQTVLVYVTPTPRVATATETLSPALSSPPSGIWCLVQQGQMPRTSACEIYPSSPQLTQNDSILAGTPVGPEIGKTGATSVTESLQGPLWAADVICATSDNSNGEVQILMVAHTSGGDYYSWGNESCGPPAAPDNGNEFFRKATVTVTLSIQPVTGNLLSWTAQLLQL